MLGQFASMLFALPTTVLLWLATNKYLTFWGPENAFLDSIGFWAIFGLFAFTSLFYPRLFPSLLGKAWNGLMKAEKWL
ncbi:hypothetical protein OW492_04995 [Psychromonas sp. 14N.309.X.WAT.B.A12]|uniref:hypothetical protein n=1 Tax=Psychromonas sp. 14N.309.X.WAT.B.A12 TaxID=2998322 RepID=UPI0025B1A473|nr:hypothetical protein [Psychromonas sp. 14N.309.X.WAT.B.A12]MDN2662730.1 hypothetical protein [Psychromonas sp. 14N.309.X.WAT.B.A12]